MTRKMRPSLGKKLMEKFQECFNRKQDFANNVDKYVFMHECSVYIIIFFIIMAFLKQSALQ